MATPTAPCSAVRRLRPAQLLARLQRVAEELRQTTSLNQKLAIVRAAPDLHPFLRFLYTSGPFHLTAAGLARQAAVAGTRGPPAAQHEYLEDLLGSLADRTLAGRQAVLAFNRFAEQHPDHRELLEGILEKDLRIRLGPSSVLKAAASLDAPQQAPGPVALAADLRSPSAARYFDASLAAGQRWYASRKLDGIRCIAALDCAAGSVQLRSRQGKSLNNLALAAHFRQWAASLRQHLGPAAVYVDGEVCCFGDRPSAALADGTRESFSAANSIVMKAVRNEFDPANRQDLHFVAFDLLYEREYRGESPSRPFFERLSLMQSTTATDYIRFLPHVPVESREQLDELLATARRHQWEGLMLRRSASAFQGKRTMDLLKCKDFSDAEFRIVGFTTAPFRVVEGGREKTETLLASLDIEYKDNIVSVGSGFSLEERRHLLAAGPALIGQMVTVCYFEETLNKATGKASLRYPIFKSLYSPI